MIYIIASSYQAATDFCQNEMNISPASKMIKIFTETDQIRGLILNDKDGWEIVYRPSDIPDPYLLDEWHSILQKHGTWIS